MISNLAGLKFFFQTNNRLPSGIAFSIEEVGILKDFKDVNLSPVQIKIMSIGMIRILTSCFII
jgi:hypothetical protein